MAICKALLTALVSACVQAADVDTPLFATWFARYPEYVGALEVFGGSVTFGKTGDNELVLSWFFHGGDAACNGTDNGKANSCGVHIHAGSSCAIKSAVGGHYFKGTSDPWASIQYTTSNDHSSKSNVVVAAGTSLAENQGRVVVIHDASGARIACSPLMAAEPPVSSLGLDTLASNGLQVKPFGMYPDYSGKLSVSGSTQMVQTTGFQGHGPAFVLEFSLTGTDPNCSASAMRTKANACGIHIHSGDCSSKASVGGHYYESWMPDDPWKDVVYFSDKAGATGRSTTFVINVGLPLYSVRGRSVVVHDIDGSRIACADIKPLATSKGFLALP